MKYTAKKIYFYIVLIGIISQISCSKSVFTKTNDNQNSPPTVIPANILPGLETNLAYTQGGDITRFANLLVQQNVGFSRQAAAYYTYVFTSTDFDSPWGNMYTSVMGNDRDMMLKADASGYNIYSGISRIIMAYSLQLLVDEWGNVPYSDALTGLGNEVNTHPSYDDAKSLYDTIKNLVDVGITQLSNSNPGGQEPGTDDLIYGGDASLWIKFGHAIKARLYIHQSNGDANMAAQALAEANMSFESNSENAQFKFGNSPTFANPIWEFNDQRTDIDYGAGAYADLLTSLNDPRLGLTADPTYSDGEGVGIGSYYGDQNGHVEFITYDELLLLKAEASLRSGASISDAQTYYQAGIQASMDKLGVNNADATAYIEANGVLPANLNNAIAAVATQEYISLYVNPEAFTSWRRTGFPKLSPTSGSNGIPRRFLYPQNEYSLNAKNAPQATLFSPKLFWDK